MAIAGPRLDRPSAIGDEGRPRAASLTVAAFIVLALVVTTALLVDIASILTTVASGVLLFVTGIALLRHNSYRSLYGGHLCLHAGVGMVVGVVVFALIEGPRVLIVGYVITLFGVGTTWTDTLEKETFRETLSQSMGSYLRMAFVFIVLMGLLLVALLVSLVLYVFTDVTTPGIALVGFFGILTGVATAFALLVRALPLAVLVANASDDRVRRWRVATALGAGGSFLYLLVSGAAAVSGGFAEVTVAVPQVETIALLFSTLPVVAALAILGTLSTVVALVGWLVPFVADRVDAGDSETLARWTAGVSLAVFLVGALLTPLAGPPLLGIVVVVFALVGLPVALVLVLFVPSVVAEGYMAKHATGAALSSAGLVLVGIGTALAGLPAPLTFATIVGAIVVWDVSTFGTGLTLELGHIPDTRRLELYHALLSVGVGVVAVIGFSVLNVARRAIGRSATFAAVLAIVGVVFLVLADRQRGR